MGDDGQGSRYYAKLATKDTFMTSVDRESYERDGYTCMRSDSILNRANKEGYDRMWGYTVSDSGGSLGEVLKGYISISDKGFLTALDRYSTISDMDNGISRPPAVPDIPRPDLILESFNNLYNNGKMLYLETGDHKPSPNALYYGFNSDGFDIQIKTDQNGLISSVKNHDPNGVSYNRLLYTMYGRAMMVTLRNEIKQRMIMTEPVDKDKFDGTNQSFPAARLDTLEGIPLRKGQLPQLLKSQSPPEGEPSASGESTLAPFYRRFRNLLPALIPRTRGVRKDDGKRSTEDAVRSLTDILSPTGQGDSADKPEQEKTHGTHRGRSLRLPHLRSRTRKGGESGPKYRQLEKDGE
ncbi:hypothetical protein FOL47_004023 [Perkinsus chesapeaki]|uniref:Uncharacterized protein n=1 Tax=Perkinsus chesapeaki TaxID=330153 RepID=A0A7J6M4S5_PERCH|nr:hypothetical protein FOL47_004023 [Perkinsus chesapeaki]